MIKKIVLISIIFAHAMGIYIVNFFYILKFFISSKSLTQNDEFLLGAIVLSAYESSVTPPCAMAYNLCIPLTCSSTCY